MLVNSPTEPLVLADGRKIDPATGKVVKEARFVEVPAPSEAQEIVVRARKTVSELPLPPKQMSGVGLIAFYTLFGLRDMDIAVATGATVDQIARIRSMQVYKEFMDEARRNILEAEQENVRAVFQQQARNAAMRIVEHAQSDDSVLSFKASQDILDRAGHRPADVVEHRHKMENALKIVVVEQERPPEVPDVEGDYEAL